MLFPDKHNPHMFEEDFFRMIHLQATVLSPPSHKLTRIPLTIQPQNPGGSSSGPAIAVAAGYAPASIGTETFGSLMLPAGRAALFSIQPSRGIVSTNGIVPISSFSDAPGPMTKTTKDLALLMDVLVDPSKTRVPEGGYVSRVTGLWEGLRIGTLDPEKWNFGTHSRKILDPSMEEQLVRSVVIFHQGLSNSV